jgi:hypothetical protein
MITHEAESDVRVSTLMGEIIQDARRLMVEQLTLFQVEIKNDVHRMLYAMIPLLAGALAALPAIFLLGMAVAYALSWFIPSLPTWGGFAIVGAIIAAGAAALIFWGVQSLRTISPMPDTALKGLKENLQWKTKN